VSPGTDVVRKVLSLVPPAT